MSILSFILVSSTLAAAGPPVLITAAATTSAPGSTSIACLLDPACKGLWKPGGHDQGVDEGIALRFDAVIPDGTATALELTQQTHTKAAPFHVSFAGREEPFTSTDGFTWRAKWSTTDQVFIRVAAGPVELRSIRVIGASGPLALVTPTAVKAKVTASSVLEPRAAYQPAKLFDSRTEQAWATDGTKTDGKGVKLVVTFDAPQEIAGLITWNGYQRSDTHLVANSRLKKVTVNAGGASRSLGLNDGTVGRWQRSMFTAPLPASASVEVVVDDVIKGDKYKDLVVSELRFVDKAGRIVQPVVDFEDPASDAKLAPLLDRSFAGVVAGSGAATWCSDRRLRLRSDGSFVIYTDTNMDQSDGILEGNWAIKKGALKIFGKKYRTDIVGEYAGLTETKPEIFESALKVAPLAELTDKEKQAVVNAVVDVAGANGATAIARDRTDLVPSAASHGDLVKAVLAKLLEKKALGVISDAYVDAVLPTDELGPCK